jgi:hypothetical protein
MAARPQGRRRRDERGRARAAEDRTRHLRSRDARLTDPRQALESLQHDPADAIITEPEHRDTVARLARGAIRAAVAEERVDLPPPRVSGYDVVVSPANPFGSCRRIAEVIARESRPQSP